MGDYRTFDQLRTTELTIVKNGFWYPAYELTDGQFVYGQLSYRANFKRDGVIETAQGTWTIKRKGWFKRSFLLNQNEDETIGTLIPETWLRNVNLKMDSGFEASYQYKKILSRSLVLTHDTLGDILKITGKAFNFKRPYTITLEQITQQNDMPPIPLLALIGVNIILIRQQQAAAS
jgi:hypothetical protein